MILCCKFRFLIFLHPPLQNTLDFISKMSGRMGQRWSFRVEVLSTEVCTKAEGCGVSFLRLNAMKEGKSDLVMPCCPHPCHQR